MGVIAYTALKYYRDKLLTGNISTADTILQPPLQNLLRSENDFELAVDPESNIVCFRYAPSGYNDQTINKLNSIIRDKIIKGGIILYCSGGT